MFFLFSASSVISCNNGPRSSSCVYGRKDGYKGGVRVGFIYIKDMYNNDVGKGGAYAYEAYEAK